MRFGRRRDRIIDAAIDCIAEHGVAGTRFALSIADTFIDRMTTARTADDALAAIVELIHDDLQRSAREHALTYEL